MQNIQRFVVLMMENRSFDHLFGYLKTIDPRIVGLTDGEYQNYPDPLTQQQTPVQVTSGAAFAMPFDPPHEFCDVQKQLYGPDPTGKLCSNPRVTPALMNGFVYVGNQAAAGQGGCVMQCFATGQVPCLMTLAQEFALFNFWYSSLPGPTWPNRFFIHAATSGGLSDSPSTAAITTGFSFKNDTIYHALTAAGKDWRIYHDGLPQSSGIDSLRMAYVDPFTTNFREMQYFAQDVSNKILPEYTFIEPCYGGFLSSDFVDGNSMHPQDDVRKGDALIKLVYEALRQSDYWQDTMLIITFDEHGGFFDHVPPPAAVATGDDAQYANPADNFGFDLYGIRVPGVVISAYTQKGTVIGTDPADPTTICDHTSVLATVEARFGLAPLTARDKAANTLAASLNLDTPRTDAPLTLPDPSAPVT
ncbi:MAG: alkaline phosphatase family protein [Verrucomicrobiota bacterium]